MWTLVKYQCFRGKYFFCLQGEVSPLFWQKISPSSLPLLNEDEENMLLQNVSNHPQDHMVSQYRRLQWVIWTLCQEFTNIQIYELLYFIWIWDLALLLHWRKSITCENTLLKDLRTMWHKMETESNQNVTWESQREDTCEDINIYLKTKDVKT